MDIYVNQQKVRLTAKNAIGKGGEADVFQWRRDRAIKVFKPPDHPDFAGMPEAQQAARDRLRQHQQKLRQFPVGLPERVISPQELAMDKRERQILGYTMPLVKDTEVLLRYGDRAFRQGIAAQTVVDIFLDLHRTITQLHQQNVVIGDFNDLNVLVKDRSAYIIDTDSFQFGAFSCPMFTARFVDPLLCDPDANQPILQQSHTVESDWYAFSVMLMQCLLFVDPYGGVHKPKDKSQRVPQSARSLKRITVFHPEVRYPKPALPYDCLPDELLQHFHQVFEQDWRGMLPRSLLESLRWTTCTTCGIDHARSHCPNCTVSSPIQASRQASAIPTETVYGNVTVTPVFTTEGIILSATVEAGKLSWIYWEQDAFKREDGTVLLNGSLMPNLRWRIQGGTTLIGQQGQVVCLVSPQSRLAVESYGAIAQFDVNSQSQYWINQGQLLRRQLSGNQMQTSVAIAQDSSIVMGTVLPGGHTQIWVGDRFGFGFYQAGELTVAFVFDGERPGINDRVQLPTWQGALIHATCGFNRSAVRKSSRGWLFLITQEQGQIHYRCIVLNADGTVLAETKASQGLEHWLAHLGDSKALFIDPCPFYAVNDFLLAATDTGIIRIDRQNDQLMQTKVFPDTEPFVDSSCRLLPATSGLYAVSAHHIQQLQLT
ncbi:MAG: hypothetical protein AAGD25_01460 [Cyanobacteria bacterium P01_F01_bin.150]